MITFPEHKAGLTLSHNDHKNLYQSIEDYIEYNDLKDDFPSQEEMQKSIVTDSIWVLHWYPRTPVGFYSVAAATLEECIRHANCSD